MSVLSLERKPASQPPAPARIPPSVDIEDSQGSQLTHSLVETSLNLEGSHSSRLHIPPPTLPIWQGKVDQLNNESMENMYDVGGCASGRKGGRLACPPLSATAARRVPFRWRKQPVCRVERQAKARYHHPPPPSLPTAPPLSSAFSSTQSTYLHTLRRYACSVV